MLEIVLHCWSRLANFTADESGGERDTLTTLLILALIIIPLVLVIIFFGNQIIDFAQNAWQEVMGQGVGGGGGG